MGVSPRSPTSGSRPSSVVWMQWRCLLSPSRRKSWGNAWRHCPTTMMTSSGSPPWRSWVSEARHEVSFLGLDKALKHDHNILQTEIVGWILMFFLMWSLQVLILRVCPQLCGQGERPKPSHDLRGTWRGRSVKSNKDSMTKHLQKPDSWIYL